DLRRAGDPRRDPRAQRRAVGAGGKMRLSVVIPAHNEAASIAETVRETATELERHEIDYEIVVVDDASGDGTGDRVRELIGAWPRVRCERSTLPPGFGHAVRHGLSLYAGDAVAVMMGDL